jgi:vacuolar-type H+-ATPase subunit E/Vma4
VGLEHLRHALERRAEEAAKAEIEAARAEAARIETEAAERLARRMSGDLEEQAVVLRAAAERAVAETRRTERRRVLEAREHVLARIFARAEEIVATRQDGSEQADLLAREVRRALDYLGGVPAVVHCAPAVVERLRALLVPRDGMTVQSDPALRAGVRVVAADGSVLVDYTPERRLAALRPRLAIGLLRQITPPS